MDQCCLANGLYYSRQRCWSSLNAHCQGLVKEREKRVFIVSKKKKVWRCLRHVESVNPICAVFEKEREGKKGENHSIPLIAIGTADDC